MKFVQQFIEWRWAFLASELSTKDPRHRMYEYLTKNYHIRGCRPTELPHSKLITTKNF